MSKIEDRELLELAAKACGSIEFRLDPDGQPRVRAANGVAGPWNSLADDGDCARLEAELFFDVIFGTDSVLIVFCGGIKSVREKYSDYRNDRNAARRRASTRAAAEIGRSSREDHRQRVLVKMYANFSRLRTGDNTGQMMTRVRMRDDYDCAPWPQLAGGQLDATEWMPAGSMCSDWQRECRRP